LAARAVDEQVAHKLQLVVALLDSPVEGERHAALAAGARLLAKCGHRWGDLLTIPPPSGDHVRRADDLLLHAELLMTPFERNFAIGIRSYRRLSPKQSRLLDDIEQAVADRRAE
jgi:hypothetical protein